MKLCVNCGHITTQPVDSCADCGTLFTTAPSEAQREASVEPQPASR